jgi:hypothetical protein
MMSRIAFGFSVISLLLNVYRTFALVPCSWLSNRLSHQRFYLNESPLDAESKEVFNENDNSLTGEPRWFDPTVQSDVSVELAEVDIVDRGIILRRLPLYLLNDDQCFPTG